MGRELALPLVSTVAELHAIVIESSKFCRGSDLMRPFARTLLVAAMIASLGVAFDAAAHHVAKVDPPRRTALATDPVVAKAGVVSSIVVENRVNDTRQEYAVLTADDGTRYLLQGAAAASLRTGATYAIDGRINGQQIYVDGSSAIQANMQKARATTLTVDGYLRLGHADNFDGTPSSFFYAVTNDKEQRWVTFATLLDGLENGMPAVVSGEVQSDGSVFADRIVVTGASIVKPVDGPLASAVTTSYLVMPVKFPTNAAPPYTYGADPFTVASLRSSMFDPLPTKSVAEFYKEVSYGMQLLSGAVADNGSGGWLLANAAKPATCDINAIATPPGTAPPRRAATTSLRTWAASTCSTTWPGVDGRGSRTSGGHARTSTTRRACSSWAMRSATTSDSCMQRASIAARVSSAAPARRPSTATRSIPWATSARCISRPRKRICSDGCPQAPSSITRAASRRTRSTRWKIAGGARYAVRIPAGPKRTYWIEYRQPDWLRRRTRVVPEQRRAGASGDAVRVDLLRLRRRYRVPRHDAGHERVHRRLARRRPELRRCAIRHHRHGRSRSPPAASPSRSRRPRGRHSATCLPRTPITSMSRRSTGTASRRAAAERPCSTAPPTP